MEERSLFLTVMGHAQEYLGNIEKARQHFEGACRYNFHGNQEQRDLQRFLAKHDVGRRPGPPLWPKDLGERGRCMRLPGCPPEREADTLRRVAGDLEHRGELLQARDTLHDLYLFDPCDASVFQRARHLERQPLMQQQLKAVIAERRLALQARRATNQQPVLN